MSGREDRAFGIGGDGVDFTPSFRSDFQLVADRGRQQFLGRIMIARIIAEEIGIVERRYFLRFFEVEDPAAGNAVRRRISTGEEGGESRCLIDVAESEADVMVNGSFVEKAFESAFAEGVVEIFDIIAAQLVDRDVNDQLRGMLLRLKVTYRQNRNQRGNEFYHSNCFVFLLIKYFPERNIKLSISGIKAMFKCCGRRIHPIGTAQSAAKLIK